MRSLIATLLAAAAGGCVGHVQPAHYHPPPQGEIVVVERVHVHDATCGHYYYGNTWYYMQGHRHGPGCGHHWDGRV